MFVGRHENFQLDLLADTYDNFRPGIDENFQLDPLTHRHGSCHGHRTGSILLDSFADSHEDSQLDPLLSDRELSQLGSLLSDPCYPVRPIS